MSEGRRVSAFKGFLDKSKQDAASSSSSKHEIDLQLFDLALTTAEEEEQPKEQQIEEEKVSITSPKLDETNDTKDPVTDIPPLSRPEFPIDASTLDSKTASNEPASESSPYEGWTQYIDDESGLPYWYNEQTGEAKWVEVDTAAAQAPIEVKGVWEKYYDDQGNPFYYNTVTGVSDWEIPADAIISNGLEHGTMTKDSTGSTSTSLKSALKKGSSIKSIRSARSFGLSRVGSVRFASFSDKAMMIEDQTSFLERTPSNSSIKEMKTVGSFKLSRVPSVADNLKPVIPIKRKAKNGFQILKEGATVLRQQRDSEGLLWIEYQAVDEGPIFYATEDPESGQWNKPDLFDVEESPIEIVDDVREPDTNEPASESSPYEGWTQYIDDESGLPYWYNEQTGEAKWVEVDTAAAQAPIEVKGVWEKYFDDQGNPFYYNTVTGVSDWEIPADAIISTGLESTVSTTHHENTSIKRGTSIKSIRSARSFGLSRIGSVKFTDFSDKVVMIEDQTGKFERGYSTKSLKSIKSAASFKLSRAPSVADNLKPKVPLKQQGKSGFQILKEGATILRQQRDSDGILWIEYQAANDGPVFYGTDDLESGQWNKPEVFDLLESPRDKKKCTNGSASPSDSSLSASNELVLDFFTLDNDEALKIMSPALARLPSFEPKPQGTPIALLENNRSNQQIVTSSINEDIFDVGNSPAPVRDNLTKPPLGTPRKTDALSQKLVSPRQHIDIPSQSQQNTNASRKSTNNSQEKLDILDVSFDGSNLDLLSGGDGSNIGTANSNPILPLTIESITADVPALQDQNENILAYSSRSSLSKNVVQKGNDSLPGSLQLSVESTSQPLDQCAQSVEVETPEETAEIKVNVATSLELPPEPPVILDQLSASNVQEAARELKEEAKSLDNERSEPVIVAESSLDNIPHFEKSIERTTEIPPMEETIHPIDVDTVVSDVLNKPPPLHPPADAVIGENNGVQSVDGYQKLSGRSTNSFDSVDRSIAAGGEKDIALSTFGSRDSISSLKSLTNSPRITGDPLAFERPNPINTTIKSIQEEAMFELQKLREKLETAKNEFISTAAAPVIVGHTTEELDKLIHNEALSNSLSTDSMKDSPSPSDIDIHQGKSPLSIKVDEPPSNEILKESTSFEPKLVENESTLGINVPQSGASPVKSLSKNNAHDDSLFSLDEFIFTPAKTKQSLTNGTQDINWIEVKKRSQELEKGPHWTSYFDFDSLTKFYCNNLTGQCQLEKPVEEEPTPFQDLFSAKSLPKSFEKDHPCSTVVVETTQNSAPVQEISQEECTEIQPVPTLQDPPTEFVEVSKEPISLTQNAIVNVASEVQPEQETTQDQPIDQPESFLKEVVHCETQSEQIFPIRSNSQFMLAEELNLPTISDKNQVVKELAAVERTSSSKLHAFLQRDYQNQDDESKLLLKRLQALNTMTRTKDIQPNPNLAELDADGLKRLQNKSRHILERCCNLLERIELSNVEHAISERQLLRAAIYQRNSLSGTSRDLKHDSSLYAFSPSVCFFPSSKAFDSYWHNRLPNFQHGSWNCYKSFQEMHSESLKHKKNGDRFVIYRKQDGKFCQLGEPFDLSLKSRTNNLKREEWSEFIINAMVRQSTLEHLGIELLQDEYGGYLFYCPIRKSYSSTGIFDQASITKITFSQRNAGSERSGSHHVWNAKFAAKKVNRMMSSSNTRRKTMNVWEKFPNLKDNYTDEIDTSTFFLTSEQPMGNMLNSTGATSSDIFYRSLNLLPSSDPKHKIHRSFDIYRSAFDDLRKNSQEFSLSHISIKGIPTEQPTENLLSSEEKEMTFPDEVNKEGADHWNILHDAFGIAQQDLNIISGDVKIPMEHNVHGEVAHFDQIYRMLKFEEQMDLDSYKRYDTLVVSIADSDSENPIPLLELVEFLILEGLGKPALAVLKQAIDVMLTSPIYNEVQQSPQPFEFALSRILSMKMSEKYFNFYEKYDSVIELLQLYSGGSSSTASAIVLTTMANYFQRLQHFEWSESLLVAALLANHNNELTLLRYAELLARKGDFRGALRYLHRITSQGSNSSANDKKRNNHHHHSQMVLRMAQLEESWIMDLFQSEPQNHEAIISSYKSVFQSQHGDRIQSLALHSLAAFCLAQGYSRNQVAEYLQRSIQSDPDNAFPFFLYASISTVFQTCRKVFTLRQQESSSRVVSQTTTLKKKENSGGSKTTQKISSNNTGTATLTSNASHAPSVSSEGIQLPDDNPSNFYGRDQIDSSMRRGLVLMSDVKYRWIPLLSYADFIHLSLKDLARAKDYYEEAMRLSFSTEISPILALVHFYQYSLNDYRMTNRLLLRAMRSRHGNTPITNLCHFHHFHKPLRSEVVSSFENLDEEEKMIFSMGPPDSPVRDKKSFSSTGFKYHDNDSEDEEYRQSLIPCQDRLDCISLYTAVGYYLWDLGVGECNEEMIAAAKCYAMASLKLQRNYSPALRLIGLISFFEGDSTSHKRVGVKYVSAASNAVFSSTTTSSNMHGVVGDDSFDVPLEKSKCWLQKHLMNTMAIKTNAMMKAYWSHYDQAIALFEKSLSISPTCILTHRSLAMLYYLYKDNVTKVLSHLTMAYELSQSEDIECLRWKAQILMDHKEYEEARLLLQEVIQKVPFDPISFTNLAWCMYYIQKSTSLGGMNTMEQTWSHTYTNEQESFISDFHGHEQVSTIDEDDLPQHHRHSYGHGSGMNDKQGRRKTAYRFNPESFTPTTLQKLSHSKDCQELFHLSRALVTLLTAGGKRTYSDGLSDTAFEKMNATKMMFTGEQQRKHSPLKKDPGMNDSASLEKAIKKTPFDDNMTGYSVASYIHYWCGVYFYQESKSIVARGHGSHVANGCLQQAVSMFTLASNVQSTFDYLTENEDTLSSSSPHPGNKDPHGNVKRIKNQQLKKIRLHNAMFACLSKYYLGMIHEQKENLQDAEQCFEEALSISLSCLNLNPIVLLRFIKLMESALLGAKESLQRLNHRDKVMKKSLKKKKKNSASGHGKKGTASNKKGSSAISDDDFTDWLHASGRGGAERGSNVRRGIGEMADNTHHSSSTGNLYHNSDANLGYQSDSRPSSAFFTPKRNTWQDLNSHQHDANDKLNPGGKMNKTQSTVLNLHSASHVDDMVTDSHVMQARNISSNHPDDGQDIEEIVDPYEEEDDGGILNLSQLQKSLDAETHGTAKPMSPEMIHSIKRVLMYRRILETALVKKFSSEKMLKDLAKVEVPKKSFVFIQMDWMEKTLYAMGKCEDWSALLLSMNDCYI